MGLRLVLAARKSRKGDESSQYARQDDRAGKHSERDGHTVVATVHDTVSSQTAPWERRNLKAWMTDPAKLAMYDGILISDTDRLSRTDDKGWHFIESWCYDHDKKILTAEGVQFPPRDDSDRYQWLGLKRRARTYWEDVRDKHAQTRDLIKANGGAIGRPPFGYMTSGEKLRKTFLPDPVNGPLAKEAFVRISQGHTASSVAIWLTEITGDMWRIKRVTDMIRRRTYLGEREGFTFEPLVTVELWESANAALNARSFKHGADKGGGRIVHGYSGLIHCECGRVLYRHKSERGREKYVCSKGRSGDVTEARCSHGAPLFAPVNEAIDRLMSRLTLPERVLMTTGGDYGKQSELARIKDDMAKAQGKSDMTEVIRLAQEYSEVEAREIAPIVTTFQETGRAYGKAWQDGSLNDRRSLLERGEFKLIVKEDEEGWRIFLEPSAESRESFRIFRARDYRISMSEEVIAS